MKTVIIVFGSLTAVMFGGGIAFVMVWMINHLPAAPIIRYALAFLFTIVAIANATLWIIKTYILPLSRFQ